MSPDSQFVLDKADEIGASVYFDAPCNEGGSAYAWMPNNSVHLCVDGAEGKGYWIALHELGHIATGKTEDEMDDESRAWLWALGVSHRPLDDEGREQIAVGIGSHWAGRHTPFEDPYGDSLAQLIRTAGGKVDILHMSEQWGFTGLIASEAWAKLVKFYGMNS